MDKSISFEEWKKMQMKVGKVVRVEKIPIRDKFYKLQGDFRRKKTKMVANVGY